MLKQDLAELSMSSCSSFFLHSIHEIQTYPDIFWHVYARSPDSATAAARATWGSSQTTQQPHVRPSTDAGIWQQPFKSSNDECNRLSSMAKCVPQIMCFQLPAGMAHDSMGINYATLCNLCRLVPHKCLQRQTNPGFFVQAPGPQRYEKPAIATGSWRSKAREENLLFSRPLNGGPRDHKIVND